ncbi:MAG: methyltransferase domain-containing protein [Polyangiaceae bacterium]
MSIDPHNLWDPKRYAEQARFVHEGGKAVVELLSPRAGERVLDLGCGGGELTRLIADSGAQVLGIDSSPQMLTQARAAYPELRFEQVEAEALDYDAEFDAVFSNAALHWMPRADEVASAMHRALRSGGRLAAEFGGHQNVLALRQAASAALTLLGRSRGDWNPWYFPRLGEYSSVLERAGFTVRFALWFERPSPMPDTAEQSGIANWLSIFASELVQSLPADERKPFFAAVEDHARARLFRDGVWWLDYARLRVEASKA